MNRFAAAAIAALLALVQPCISSANEIIVNAVGDIMLGGRWTPLLKKKGYDYPFAAVRAELEKGDVNLANLESPIARSGTEFSGKKYRFRADPALAPALQRARFHIVTLANNHSMDFGEEALGETLLHLDRAGIGWIGAGRNLAEARQMAIFTINGRKIAFLGYSLTQPTEFYAGQSRAGTAPGLEEFYCADIKRARAAADHVIVSFHWGTEGSTAIRPYQRRAAHKAIDAGADAVIGHHPHVLQGIERYNKGIIFYSLGNFAFASTSTIADVGALVRLRLSDTNRQAEIVPLDVLASRVQFQPRILAGSKGLAVVEKLKTLSQPLGTTIESHGDRYRIPF